MKKVLRLYDPLELKADAVVTKAFEYEIQNILSFQDTFQRLEISLKSFESNIERCLSENEFLDVKLARELYVLSCALFRVCQKANWEAHVPFSLAAVSYFTNQNDGINDFQAIDGFEDDKLVLTHLIKHFKLEVKIENEIQEMKKSS